MLTWGSPGVGKYWGGEGWGTSGQLPRLTGRRFGGSPGTPPGGGGDNTKYTTTAYPYMYKKSQNPESCLYVRLFNCL